MFNLLWKDSLIFLLIPLLFITCKEEVVKQELVAIDEKKVENLEFGFNLDNFIVKRDTIKRGESFGEILSKNNLGYSKIFQIAEKAKDSYDIRKLRAGKPYTLLCAKDSLQTPQSFIYQPSKIDYVVIDFQDSIIAYKAKKPITYLEKTLTATIDQNISLTLEERGVSQKLAHLLADDIYAWTIDFRRLQKGDRFKVVYMDRYIDDTTYAGVSEVKAAYFEHKGESLYAFQFETDSIKGIVDYFNENAKNLRRAFLKSPVKFSRISSRYNLKRRIAYYGNKIRPHRGTDFAAPIGTEIMATANGTVVESTRRGGNGKYVKIRHNDTYSTQYLHMSRQAVKKGDYVQQGDVIGYIGMTGNTSGPHVCYRFWKNGVQVDPFKQKLPESQPIEDSLKQSYLEHIKPLKKQLDDMFFLEVEQEQNTPSITKNTTPLS